MSILMRRTFQWNLIFPYNLSTHAVWPESALQSQPAFAHARLGVGDRTQCPAVLHNPFEEDITLQRYLRRTISNELWDSISKDLRLFGERIVNECEVLHRECDKYLPRHEPFDAWGRRIDNLWTCPAWSKQKKIAAEEGVVAIGYEIEKWKEFNRLFQFSKLYLYCPSAGLYSCPVAMTDGAAKVLKSLNIRPSNIGSTDAFSRLISRDPKQFWTSGQWMTERQGGSDVGTGTETMAFEQADGSYRLYGYKWFSSATDADITLTLAKIVQSTSNDVEKLGIRGSKGLSLFFANVRDLETGKLNGVEIVRLKNKLGTRQVPTAELLLDGMRAFRICEDGKGVASIAHMLNITRLHNAISSVGAMRRIINLARDYAHRRKAFGRLLVDHSLHIQTLSRMEVEARGGFLLVMELARLLGLQESGKATQQQLLLMRLLFPVAKLFTAKQAMAVVSEGLECFGGQGYIEDTGLPSMLRDAQVLPIWEGTTNVLSLDVLRHLGKHAASLLTLFRQEINDRLINASQFDELEPLSAYVVDAIDRNLIPFVSNHAEKLELAARDFAMSIGRIFIAAMLVEHASVTTEKDDVHCAEKWIQKEPLCSLKIPDVYSDSEAQIDKEMLLKEYKLFPS